MTKQELCERWIRIIRDKSFEYEVPIRAAGNDGKITKPDLLDIANEIEAFFTGLIDK